MKFFKTIFETGLDDITTKHTSFILNALFLLIFNRIGRLCVQLEEFFELSFESYAAVNLYLFAYFAYTRK